MQRKISLQALSLQPKLVLLLPNFECCIAEFDSSAEILSERAVESNLHSPAVLCLAYLSKSSALILEGKLTSVFSSENFRSHFCYSR